MQAQGEKVQILVAICGGLPTILRKPLSVLLEFPILMLPLSPGHPLAHQRNLKPPLGGNP